jgi:hypothetical protein
MSTSRLMFNGTNTENTISMNNECTSSNKQPYFGFLYKTGVGETYSSLVYLSKSHDTMIMNDALGKMLKEVLLADCYVVF